MTLNATIARLGRPIRIALAGGGEGSVIGSAHRTAIRFDGYFDIVAGVVSSNPKKALAQGKALGLARPYATIADMLREEAAHPQGADAISIVTPNDSHFPIADAALDAGLHVLCDKPLANTIEQAVLLRDKAERLGLVLGLSHNYSAYPMVRHARALVAAGDIGRVHLVEVRSVQGNLGGWIESDPAALPSHVAWRLDPARGGRDHLLLDIGTHVHQLAVYVVGRGFTEVLADAGPSIAGRVFDDTAVIMARMEGDLRTSLLMTKAATGAPNDLSIEVYGDQGGLRWEQSDPNILLLMREGSSEIIRRSAPSLSPLGRRSIRIPYPHPEGVREAFANIYADFAEQVAARIAGDEPDPLSLTLPTAATGVDGLCFVEACHRSKLSRSWTPVGKA